MKILMMIIAIGEALIGLILFVFPRQAVQLLFYASIGASGAIMTHIAGIALIGLGVACWPGTPRQPTYGMLTYSTLIILYLIIIGVGGNAGLLLWPTVGLHALIDGLLVWVLARKLTSA